MTFYKKGEENMPITITQIETQRKKVRKTYDIHGFPSQEYEEEFDKLHRMNMVYNAEKYRRGNCLPTNAKTPYCE